MFFTERMAGGQENVTLPSSFAFFCPVITHCHNDLVVKPSHDILDCSGVRSFDRKNSATYYGTANGDSERSLFHRSFEWEIRPIVHMVNYTADFFFCRGFQIRVARKKIVMSILDAEFASHSRGED